MLAFKREKLDQSRWLLLCTLLLVFLLSWYYMVFAMTMNMEPVAQWQLNDIILLFIMWSIMMFGMMIPSAMPIFLLIENLNKQRKKRNKAPIRTSDEERKHMYYYCIIALRNKTSIINDCC